jgi:ribosomal protein S27AE
LAGKATASLDYNNIEQCNECSRCGQRISTGDADKFEGGAHDEGWKNCPACGAVITTVVRLPKTEDK